jgi:glycosyltransferase involved in cell wall biosynthesis
MRDTYIVVAAYNEEKKIKNVIQSLNQEGYNNIVVVDDGSDDNTYKEAKAANAIVLKHIINRGQGATLQTGMTYALIDGAEYLVHFDADGQHNPKEIKQILEPLISGEVEATLGSRFLKKQKIPFKRKIMLKGAIFLMWLFYRARLTDTHNGFRGFSREAAKKVIMTTDRMEHASEIIELIKKRNIKYKEVPVTIKYTKESLEEGRKGQGKFDSLKILFKMILKKFEG